MHLSTFRRWSLSAIVKSLKGKKLGIEEIKVFGAIITVDTFFEAGANFLFHFVLRCHFLKSYSLWSLFYGTSLVKYSSQVKANILTCLLFLKLYVLI